MKRPTSAPSGPVILPSYCVSRSILVSLVNYSTRITNTPASEMLSGWIVSSVAIKEIVDNRDSIILHPPLPVPSMEVDKTRKTDAKCLLLGFRYRSIEKWLVEPS